MPDTYAATSFEQIVLTILAMLVILISIGCIYAFFRAIFLFLFGKDDGRSSAWNSIRYMIVGIIFTVLILFLFPYILKWAKIPNYEEVSAKNIFSKAGELAGKAFSIPDIIKDSQEANKLRGDLYYDKDDIPFDNNYQNYQL